MDTSYSLKMNRRKKKGVKIGKKQKTQQKSPQYTQKMGRKTTDNFPVVTEENQKNTCLGKRGLMKNMYIYIYR